MEKCLITGNLCLEKECKQWTRLSERHYICKIKQVFGNEFSQIESLYKVFEQIHRMFWGEPEGQ